MKKILLFSILLLFAGGLSAQSLTLFYEGTNLLPGAQIMVIGDPSAEYIQAKVDVKNNGSAAIPTKVKKVIHEGDTIPGTSNYFCWGLCFAPWTYVSPNEIVIEPGQTVLDFYGDYNPNTLIGSSKVTYVFFNRDNVNDSVAVTVEFKASLASIADPITSASLSEVYPNPAINNAMVNYTLPENHQRASIVVTNMLGSRVKEITLSTAEGQARIPVADMTNGIYFYSLVVDDRIIQTRKFIVKK